VVHVSSFRDAPAPTFSKHGFVVTEIASALLPVFFVLILGYGSGKLHLVDNNNVDSLNTLVMTIALPISLFTSLAAGKRAAVLSRWQFVLLFFAVMVVVYAGTYVMQRRLHGATPSESAIQALTVAFPNIAAVGLPLVSAVLGAESLLSVAAALGVGAIFLNPVTILLLERERGGSMGKVIVNSLTNPVVIGPILGLAWSLIGIPVPSLMHQTLTAIGSVTAGVALFLTGLVLSAQAIEFSRNAYLSSLLATVGRPALGYLVVLALGLTGVPARELVLLLAVPSAFFGVLLSVSYRVRSSVVGTTLLFSTLASVVTLSAVIVLLPRL